MLCRTLPINKIVAITRSGYAAKMIATHGLPLPILAISDDEAAARSFNLISGVTGIYSETPFSRKDTDHIAQILEQLMRKGLLLVNETVLVTGVTYPAPGARMNTIQISNMRDLSRTLEWTISE